MKKKILLTGIGSKMGGVESFATTIINGLKNEYDFSLLAATRSDIANEEYFKNLGIKIFHLENIFGIKHAVTRTNTMYNFLKQQNFDIVHINATTLNAVYIAKAARRLNLRVIYHVHNAAPSGYSLLARILTKMLSPYYQMRMRLFKNFQCVAVSKEAALAVFGKKLSVKILVNGVDTENFLFKSDVRQLMRRKFGIGNNLKVGIMVARLMPIKNYFRALDIIEEGLSNNSLDRFLIVGDGPEKNNIKKKIDSMDKKVRTRIILCGERHDVPNLLMMSDFMLLTSFSEGLATSVIEAQASGAIPVVSTGVPQITNVTGEAVFIDLGSPNQYWLDKIKMVLATNYNREALNRIVENSQFSSKKFLKSIRVLYNN